VRGREPECARYYHAAAARATADATNHVH